MAALSDIITVTISTTAAAVKAPGFGVPMILDYHTRWSERIRFYSDLPGMVTDGFVAADAAYKAASAMLAQNPQITSFAIGRRALAPDLQVDITPTAVSSKLYKVRVVGPTGATGTASFTSDASATVAEIVTGLKSAVDALAIPNVTTTDSTTHLRVKADAAGKFFAVEPLDLAIMSAKQTHADPGVGTDFDNVVLENSAWYGVTSTTASAAEVSALAAKVETAKRLSLRLSQDCDIIGSGSGDIATTLKTAAYARTGLLFHPAADSFADCAWFGATFPKNPGAITFKFKTLAGVAGVTLTATHIVNLKAKNCNYYTDFGGANITAEGYAASGQWLDFVRDLDWFEATLQADVANLLIGADKIPFTDGGIGQVETVLRARLRLAIDAGFLSASPAPVVIVPKASAVSSGDKLARTLTGVSFTATAAGAVHKTVITGTISV